MLVPWWAYGLLANVCFVLTEMVARREPTFWDALPYIVFTTGIGQWGLYHAWNGAPHWLTAWAVFTLGSSLCRVIAVRFFAAGEVSSWPVILLGVAIILAGGQLIKQGLT